MSEKTSEEDELRAEAERLRRENEALQRKTEGGISLKVSPKGGVSLYGLGRFPVVCQNSADPKRHLPIPL